MAIGKVNINNNSGNKFNIFCQTTEPKSKNGIWLKTDIPCNNIIIDDKYYLANDWIDNTLGIYKEIPYEFRSGSAVAIGTDIYLLGSAGNGIVSGEMAYTYNFKYDTIANEYTRNVDIPYNFVNGIAVAIGTDIYLLGGDSRSRMYKYNTLNNTYSRLVDLPSSYLSDAVAVGTDIYIFGLGINGNMAYKYDTLIGAYTELANIPYDFNGGKVANVGADIYLLGSASSNNLEHFYAYKYSINKNTYTMLKNIPYEFYSGNVIAVGTDIYLIGGAVSSKPHKNFFKYDILTNLYTALTPLSDTYSSGASVLLDNKIYLFGGSSSYNMLRVFAFTSKQYEENTVVLSRSDNVQGRYYTELFSPSKRPIGSFNRFLTGFDNVLLFKDNDLKQPTAYYGNGVSWIRFRI